MSDSARVFSVEDLEALHAALARFGAQGAEALSSAELEIRRSVDYIQGQLEHWQHNVLRRQEEVARARSELTYHRSMHDGSKTGAADQEIALARAQQRLREAEDKVGICRRWLRQLPQVLKEYDGYARVLAGMLDANLKQSLALLAAKIAHLKVYADLSSESPAETPPAEAPPAAPAEEPS
jgi:hypothetical protein